jgi:hypothetical protein
VRLIVLLFTIFIMVSTIMVTLAPAGEKKPSNTCLVSSKEIGEEVKKFSVFNTEISKPYAFADIGYALKWRDNQCTSIQMAFDGTAKVHDFYSENPVYVQDALYVKGSGIETPGGAGVVAFGDRKGAESFVAGRGGEIISYDDLLKMSFN